MNAKKISKSGFVVWGVRLVAIVSLLGSTSAFGWQSKASTKGGGADVETSPSQNIEEIEEAWDEGAGDENGFDVIELPDDEFAAEEELSAEVNDEDVDPGEDEFDIEAVDGEEAGVFSDASDLALSALVAPATGIDPLTVRLRSGGLNFLVREVVPCLIRDVLGEEMTLPTVSLLNKTQDTKFNVPLCGSYNLRERYRASLDNVAVTFPVCEDSITARFQTASAGFVKVSGSIQMPDASITARVCARIDRSFSGPDCLFLDDVVEDIVDLTDLRECCTITVTGVNATFRARFRQDGNILVFDALEAFDMQVGQVSFSNCGLVIDLVNIFGTLNALATAGLNAFLDNNALVRDWASEGLSMALKNAGRVRGGTSNAATLFGVAVGYGLKDMSSSFVNNRMTTNWNVSALASGAIRETPPAYVYQERTQASIPAAGDLQALLPLSLFDKFAYELARKGYFSQSVNLLGQSVKARVRGTPRAVAIPSNTQRIQLNIPIEVVKATEAQSGPTLNNVTGVIEVILSMRTNSNNGIDFKVEGANLPSLTGTVNGVSINPFRSTIETQMRNKLNALPTHTVARKITDIKVLSQSYGLQIGAINVGTKYVSVPLTFTGDCPNCN